MPDASQTDPHLTGLGRLPPGRHGLPRELIHSHQRQRIFAATVAVVARQGLCDAQVSDIHRLAGVSRRTLYEHFDGKLEAFRGVVDFGISELLRAGRKGIAAAESEDDVVRLHAALDAVADHLAEWPELGQVCLRDSFGLEGCDQIVVNGFVDLLREALGVGERPAASELFPPDAIELVAAGASLLFNRRALTGSTKVPPDLAPRLVALLRP